jgi:GNAT superfamily N-acetyltransferase
MVHLFEGDNMNIEYKETHDFTREQLEELFLSVEWSSGHYPDKLVIAMKNFKTVISAWDGDKLIGMICAMDDGIMNAYVHYLLVNPKYHGLKIGRTLVSMIKEHYKDYLRIAFIAYDEELHFYENCGFEKSKDASPMFITSLWT